MDSKERKIIENLQENYYSIESLTDKNSFFTANTHIQSVSEQFCPIKRKREKEEERIERERERERKREKKTQRKDT